MFLISLVVIVATEALEYHLVDALSYPDQMLELLAAHVAPVDKLARTPWQAYGAKKSMVIATIPPFSHAIPPFHPDAPNSNGSNVFAYIQITGSIHTGESQVPCSAILHVSRDPRFILLVVPERHAGHRY